MYTPLDVEQAAVDAADAAARAVASAQAQAASAFPQIAAPRASASQASASTPAQAAGDASGATVYQWLLAWVVVILFGVLIARTRIGYTLLYYLAALTLLFLVLTNSSWIAAAVRPITGDTTTEERIPPRGGLSEPGAIRT